MASDDQSVATDGAVRLYLCDDTEPFRALMRHALPDGQGLVVVGESADGSSVADGVVASRADVVLLDLAMPRCDGMSAIERLREQAPSCAIVVFSGFGSVPMARHCLELGAHAYVEKGAAVEEVRAIVRRAAAAHRAGAAGPADA